MNESMIYPSSLKTNQYRKVFFPSLLLEVKVRRVRVAGMLEKRITWCSRVQNGQAMVQDVSEAALPYDGGNDLENVTLATKWGHIGSSAPGVTEAILMFTEA